MDRYIVYNKNIITFSEEFINRSWAMFNTLLSVIKKNIDIYGIKNFNIKITSSNIGIYGKFNYAFEHKILVLENIITSGLELSNQFDNIFEYFIQNYKDNTKRLLNLRKENKLAWRLGKKSFLKRKIK